MVLQNVYFFEKVDERRGQPRFHDVSAFLMVFAGLAVLGFGAFFFSVSLGQGGLRCCNNTSCRRMDEKGRKRTPEKQKKLEKKTRRMHEIQENIAIV